MIRESEMNFLQNALKFTPSGGSIDVTVGAVKGPKMEFSVQDSGHGIPADKLEFVFEKFKQLGQGQAKRSGYGLGLAICKKVVGLHGGRVWAESKEGKGSRFAFELPLEPPAEATRADA